MQGEIGKVYLREIEGLGEFTFVFSKSKWEDSKKKYMLQSYFNPKNYGKVDFIVGYEIDSIGEEIVKLERDFDYFIDGARVSCLCNLENDDEGVYTALLIDYFDYTDEEIEEELSDEE